MNQLAGVLIFALAATPLTQSPAGPGQDLTGVVFLDANGNGTRDPSERGLPGIAVSNQVDVVVTGADGAYHLDPSHGYGIVFVSVPDGYRVVGAFWRNVETRTHQLRLVKEPARPIHLRSRPIRT
jgi:hypothetical protein